MTTTRHGVVYRSTGILLGSALLALLLFSCKDSGTNSDNQQTTPPPGGLTASPPSVRLLPGLSANVFVKGSKLPDTILVAPNATFATATLTDSVVAIHATANVGSTSVKVGDASSPQKTVTISITVATAAAAIIME